MTTKPIILHIGDPIQYNIDVYNCLASQFSIIQPSAKERQRGAFIKALKDKKWGDFQAICRPFWNTGGEMGRWDRELIPLFPQSVKVFAGAGTGYDWADMDVLAEYGIVYCNGASVSSEPVADISIYHILNVFRNLKWSLMAAHSGDVAQWQEAHWDVQLTAWNPRSKSLGIIGLGDIGYTIAQKAHRAFGMKIYYHDLCRSNLLAVPYGGKKIIDAELLSHFKHGSRFVNIGRGKLVDEDALVSVLESGKLHAVGLDVQFNEPHVHPKMAQMRNVALTCHSGGSVMESTVGFERLAMENCERVILGQEPLTPVNKHLLKK